MKAILKAYSTTLFITSLALGTQVYAAGDPLVEKTKSYSKSYSVSGSDKISLDNQFGDMKISTWDKNEVKVEVTIKAEAGTDAKAQAILDRINIEDGKSSNSVWFKTKMANNNSEKWEKGEKQSFSIHYTVYTPANNPLDARNKFGEMFIGDYNGEATLESSFGGLTAGKLGNAKKVSVEFGKAVIAGMTNGILSIKFSRGIISNLDGSVKASFEHCDGIKLVVNNNSKSIDIKNSFTHLFLDVSTNLSANFDIRTSFCDVKNKTSFPIRKEDEDDDRRGPKFDFNYSGKSGGGSLPIKIKSSFGDITVDHNISFDVNEKEKKEKKRKVTAV